MSKKTQKNIHLVTWITAVIAVMGLAVVAATYWDRNVVIQEVQVNDLFFLKNDQVITIAAVPAGIKPDSLDLNALVHRLQQVDYVKNVVPYIEPNGKLKLHITEREPIALLIDGNERMYIDGDGIQLPIIPKKTKNVPLLYGYDATTAGDTLKSPSFSQVRDFLLQAKQNGFGWATISEIVFDESDGVVGLSHENGVKLIFGENEFETKLQNWKAFYSQIIRTKGIDKMQQVDLRFTNQVVTREI